jgi:hypothetical protein
MGCNGQPSRKSPGRKSPARRRQSPARSYNSPQRGRRSPARSQTSPGRPRSARRTEPRAKPTLAEKRRALMQAKQDAEMDWGSQMDQRQHRQQQQHQYEQQQHEQQYAQQQRDDAAAQVESLHCCLQILGGSDGRPCRPYRGDDGLAGPPYSLWHGQSRCSAA